MMRVANKKGWNRAGFNDARWSPVVVQEAPKGTLRPQMAAPVKIMERYGVRKVTKLTPEQIASACKSTKRTIDLSAFVLDMGAEPFRFFRKLPCVVNEVRKLLWWWLRL